jgi:glutaredoxin-dependent peroxiredoxin
MVSQVQVGDKAPDFTLPDVDMKPRSLHEFLGKKVVCAFFVGAFHLNMHKGSLYFP